MSIQRFEKLRNTLSLFSSSYTFLPKSLQQQIEKQRLLQDEINKTIKKLGKEKTEKMISIFKNEAHGQINPNSDYIINKLRDARININDSKFILADNEKET